MKTKDPYVKQMQNFLNMIQGRLTHAFNEQDKGNDDPIENLYKQSFYLSFMGKTCRLDFGASEFQEIEIMLQNLINEYK